ncbi:MAG: WYL domain-containing protein [Dehalococcoidales bacterium]|nr:WYL domain-containing protein [Dehalococcoidales bacterium]
MAGNVRMRVLSVLQILTHNTDEGRTLTTPEIIDLLANRGISADRRSIYEDIESINASGWEVLRSETGKRGYYYASREFEDAEIGLMLDNLFAFSFLTEKKLGQLIDKLIRLGTSALRQNRLQRAGLTAVGTRMHEGGSIYTVDSLYRAISEERMITFFPYHLDWHKRRAFDTQEPVLVKPLHLVWHDQDYFLIAARPDGVCVHYRVDRMAELKLLERARGYSRRIHREELESYAVHVFGPTAGRPLQISLKCRKDAAELVFERFGLDIPVYASHGEYFNCDVNVTPSDALYGWLIAHIDQVELLRPKSARQALIALLERGKRQYQC